MVEQKTKTEAARAVSGLRFVETDCLRIDSRNSAGSRLQLYRRIIAASRIYVRLSVTGEVLAKAAPIISSAIGQED